MNKTQAFSSKRTVSEKCLKAMNILLKTVYYSTEKFVEGEVMSYAL